MPLLLALALLVPALAPADAPRADLPTYALGDTWVPSDGLYDLVQQVTTKSRAVGGSQHPVMKGELEGVLPLTKVRSKITSVKPLAADPHVASHHYCRTAQLR